MKYTFFTGLYLMWALIGGCSQQPKTTEPDISLTKTESQSEQNQNFSLQEISIETHKLKVEIACTPETQSRGLMFRENLPENQGMLFVFSHEQTLSFWMKNTLIPLDIAYFDAGGKIIDIQTMPAGTTQNYPSAKPAQYALEMNKNWFTKNQIKVGTQVNLPDCP